jgi:hypothetical protein
MPATRTEPEHVVGTRSDACGTVLTIHGCLDQAAGEALVQATAAAVTAGPSRLEIDLCSITGFTPDGACALAACRDLCTNVPEGLHYMTGQGPGREALLAAYADC